MNGEFIQNALIAFLIGYTIGADILTVRRKRKGRE